MEEGEVDISYIPAVCDAGYLGPSMGSLTWYSRLPCKSVLSLPFIHSFIHSFTIAPGAHHLALENSRDLWA